MTTPEEAKLIILDAAAKFSVTVGTPADDDLKRICEFLANLLQSIDIPGGHDNLSGPSDTPSDYVTAYGHTFNCLKMPLIAYDPSIAANAMQAIHIKAECTWSAKLEHQHLICTVKCQLSMFFSAIVKETWLLPPKDILTFYNKVKIQTY